MRDCGGRDASSTACGRRDRPVAPPDDSTPRPARSPLRVGFEFLAIENPKQQAQELAAAGKSIFEIAAALKLSPRVVRAFFKPR